jgi:hypothetical protein
MPILCSHLLTRHIHPRVTRTPREWVTAIPLNLCLMSRTGQCTMVTVMGIVNPLRIRGHQHRCKISHQHNRNPVSMPEHQTLYSKHLHLGSRRHKSKVTLTPRPQRQLQRLLGPSGNRSSLPVLSNKSPGPMVIRSRLVSRLPERQLPKTPTVVSGYRRWYPHLRSLRLNRPLLPRNCQLLATSLPVPHPT